MSLKKYFRSKVFPSHSDLLEILNLADSQFRDGKYVEAEKNYELWLKYYPQDAKTRLKLGGLYHTQQQIQNSYDCFEIAVKSSVNYVIFWVMDIVKDMDVPISLEYKQVIRHKYKFKFSIGSFFDKEQRNFERIFFDEIPVRENNAYTVSIEYCLENNNKISRKSCPVEKDKLENINPEEIDCSNLIKEIDELESSNQYEHAETILITVLSNYSRHPGIWYKLGTNLSHQKKWNKAKDSYEKSLSIDPDNSKEWYDLGIALINLEKFNDAIGAFDRVLILDSMNTQATNQKLSCLNILNLKQAMADKKETITSQFSEQPIQNVSTARNLFKQGTEHFNLGRYEDALTSYDKALEINPDFSKAWYNRGNVLTELDRYEDALISFDKALEIDPDFSEAWYYHGAALVHLGRYDEAVVSYDKAHKLNPEYSVPWYISSGLLGNLGQRDRAVTSFDDQIKSLEILLKNDPNCYPAWLNRGVLLAILGRYEDALASYDKVLEIDPNNEAARQGRTAALKIMNQKMSSPN